MTLGIVNINFRVTSKLLISKNKWPQKYQSVKKFHMLARMGCYCNIMVFSPFKVQVTYYDPLNQ